MIQFGVFDPEEDWDETYPDSLLTLKKFLATRPSWQPDFSDTFLLFEQLSESQNLSINPFGYLNFLSPQLSEIALRLSQGKFAALRSAGDWTPSFYWFEPEGETCYFSHAGRLPIQFESLFTLTDSQFFSEKKQEERNQFYTHVSSQTKRQRNSENLSLVEKSIWRIPFPIDGIIGSLITQVELVDQLSHT